MKENPPKNKKEIKKNHNNSFSKNIRKYGALLGIGAISVLPSDKFTQTEWTKDEIKKTEIGNLEKIKSLIYLYDKGREWVLHNIADPKYLERLKDEVVSSFPGISEEDFQIKFNEIILNRIKQALDDNFVLSKNIQVSFESLNGDGQVESFYNKNKNEVNLPLDADSSKALLFALHEYAHKVTNANKLLTSKEIALFSEAFDSSSVAKNLFLEGSNGDVLYNISYYSNPTEMYAEKKGFEYELEKFGIKKYGEKFTMKHYEEVIKNLNKFSDPSKGFIFSVKKEMFERVMNEIAEIQNKGKEGENNA